MIPFLLFLQMACAVAAMFAAYGFRDFILEAWRTEGFAGIIRSPYARLSGLLMALIAHMAVADLRVLFALDAYLAAMAVMDGWKLLIVVGLEGIAFLILILLVVRRQEAADSADTTNYVFLTAALAACALIAGVTA
jgi:hypothetical protein